MPSITRRGVLAATASAGLAALAGCNSSEDPIDRPVVERIYLRNHAGDAHSVALRVEVDGTVEHWATHDLAPAGEDGDTAVVEPPAYPAEQTSYTIDVRLLDGNAHQSVHPRVHEHTCKELTFRVTEDAGVELGTNAHECDPQAE
jgi:hypothetical protein